MLSEPHREPSILCSALDRLAREILRAVEADGRHLEEVHVGAPGEGEIVRKGLCRRLEDYGFVGVDVRVGPSEGYSVVASLYASR